eukprot:scaffold6631_cov61-Phaeocystis_antarctica.AAC.7
MKRALVVFRLRCNYPCADDHAVRIVCGGPETQARVDDLVEVIRVGELALEDADRVVDPVLVL